jgi:putative DNA primase/helicase
MNNLLQLNPTPMPEHLLQAILTSGKQPLRCARTKNEAGGIHEGGRNDTLFRHAVALHHKGVSEEGIRSSVHAINESDCDPMLHASEVDSIVDGVLRYEPDVRVNFTLTDVGNVEKFVAAQKGEVKHCFTRKRWFIWNNKRWEEDVTGRLIHRIVEWLKILEATPIDENDERSHGEKFKKHVRRTQAKARIEAIEWLSRPHCAMQEKMWDTNPHLINFDNGTLNLETLILQPHNKSDFITNMLGYSFDPAAQCPVFDQFLSRIFVDDAEGAAFVEDLMGYSLLGNPKEQKAFFFFGNGGNGKSTLMEVMLELHDSYGTATQPTTFVQRTNSSARNDLAKLAHKRLVSAPEINEGDKIDEMLLKQVTGGDTVTARFLYGEYFDFIPKFVLIFTANNLPQVKGVDEGIWRRIIVIPFLVQIPESEQNKSIKNALKREMPGIFNMALRGLARYRERGLKIPLSVERATAQYRNEANKMAEFIEDCAKLAPRHKAICSDLHKAYAAWARANGHPTLLPRDIRLILPRYGYEIRRLHGGIDHYIGIDIDKDAPKAHDEI